MKHLDELLFSRKVKRFDHSTTKCNYTRCLVRIGRFEAARADSLQRQKWIDGLQTHLRRRRLPRHVVGGRVLYRLPIKREAVLESLIDSNVCKERR